ncbi:probable proline--tRNA ligase, mitochondrial isoform X2 [Sinocyclocheilus grahami]|nr:PREDICTED: probable proline--tRNA ligase, mitochondrial isoform X2 [Sinocyclocheilus grahami]XP_016135706.1 PREDICTED: probable proline--tRNA ligase, mitochondrial isoform X2 [Sinocyclocheilus grahami]XP_016135707.1 PREDICTED: probable proline--tRNA ligase, mitochondrial isoform X2 [Sinocyclocheilus grahami]
MEGFMHHCHRKLPTLLSRTLFKALKRSYISCTIHTSPLVSVPSKPTIPPPLVSRLFQPSNFREGQEGGDMTCRSQRLMLHTGLIHPSNPGCFYYLPVALRSMEKLVRLIDEEMHAIGGQKIDMPALCSAELWKKSGRWELMGKEMFRLLDRHNAEYCLGPTHEEAVAELFASQTTISYKKLPLLLYQVTRKFRDEQKPKFGLLRGREFYMKDMYSFDINEEAALQTYHSVCQSYGRIFDRLGLTWVQVQAATGNIGGTLSHEFQLPADIGEDQLLVCGNCGFSANIETMEQGQTECSQCQTGTLTESKGIEVGHTFYLGAKYSQAFKALFVNASNVPAVAEMGCFGLGVTRILAASIEVMSSEDAIRWPGCIAPYQVCVLPPKKGSKANEATLVAEKLSQSLGNSLPNLRGEVVLDDRVQMTIGKRLKDAKVLGYPYVVVVGQKALENLPSFEVICQQSGETMFLSKEGLVDLLSKAETI